MRTNYDVTVRYYVVGIVVAALVSCLLIKSVLLLWVGVIALPFVLKFTQTDPKHDEQTNRSFN